MILLKDYDMSILYHTVKANVVVDALSRMTKASVAHVEDGKKELVKMCIDWPGWVFDLKILKNGV